MFKLGRIVQRGNKSLLSYQKCAFSKPAQFDGDAAEVYAVLFEQHLKPTGPWPMMLDYVKSKASDSTLKILDLSTGPGEPGTMIAEDLPKSNL